MPLFASLALAVQTKTTLAEYLQAHPPQGSWVAVDPEHVTAEGPTGLDSFDRKAVRIGGLTAIVPRTMVQIADLTQKMPDPDAGIAQGYELVALFASLDEGQWRHLGSDGLSLGDLRGSQRELFAAALPAPLKYTVYGPDGTTHRELSSADVLRAKLHMRRRIQLEIGSAGGRGYSLQDTDYLTDGPDRPIARLDSLGDSGTLYGVALRKILPNVPKEGGLKVDRMTGSVPPIPGTIRETLATCAPGTEILADRRIADLSVSRGGVASAGDLLQAIALGVTGVYRPVGSAYVLTSDLVGQGARALGVSSWQSLVQPKLGAQLNEWRKKMRDAGALRAIGYAKDDPLAADETFIEGIAEWGGGVQAEPIAVSQMPKAYRDVIAKVRAQRSTIRGLQDSDYDHIGVVFQPSPTLDLPDGTSVGLPNVSLQDTPVLLPTAVPRTAATATDADPMPLTGDVALVADVSTATEAEEMGRLAKRYGFRALWLETDSADALKTGLASGVPTRLAVRPWTAALGTRLADPDRNIVRERAPAASQRVAQLDALFAIRTFSLSPRGRDLVAPNTDHDPARWDAIVRLAHAEGLKGVALLDEHPSGYTRDRGRAFGSQAFSRMGYSDQARLTFLRSQGFDPIDLPIGASSLSVNLVEPFFPDVRFGRALDRRRSNPATLEAAPQAWNEQCATANEAGLEALRKALSGIDLLQTGAGGISALRPSGTGDAQAEAHFRVSLAARFARSDSGPFAIDLSDVPPNQRAALLGRLIRRRNPAP